MDLVTIQMLPANMPKLVSVRNFVSWRLVTYFSSALKIENSSLQSAGSFRADAILSCGNCSSFIAVSFPHVIRHVERDLIFAVLGHHHENLGLDYFVAESNLVDCFFAAQFRDILRADIRQQIGREECRVGE